MTESMIGIAERLLALLPDAAAGGLSRSSHITDLLITFLEHDTGETNEIRNAIETAIAPQGTLQHEALFAMTVLSGVLADPRPRRVRIATLDLMFLVLTADAPPSTEETLSQACARAARDCLWSIVRVALEDPACVDATLDVLDIIDSSGSASTLVRASRATGGNSPH